MKHWLIIHQCKSMWKVYVNKIENRNAFKIKSGYCLEILTPETMKLFGSTENKITEEKNGENVLHLEIADICSLQSC